MGRAVAVTADLGVAVAPGLGVAVAAGRDVAVEPGAGVAVGGAGADVAVGGGGWLVGLGVAVGSLPPQAVTMRIMTAAIAVAAKIGFFIAMVAPLVTLLP